LGKEGRGALSGSSMGLPSSSSLGSSPGAKSEAKSEKE
jgi:hypothetical protein